MDWNRISADKTDLTECGQNGQRGGGKWSKKAKKK